MPPRLPADFPLTQTQRSSLVEPMAASLLAGTHRLLRATGPNTRPPCDDCDDYDRHCIKNPRIGNVWALFGGRGSGKTTLLAATLDAVEREASTDAPRCAPNAKMSRLAVLEPLDLSNAPPEFPMTVTVLTGLRAAIDAWYKKHGRAAQWDVEARDAFDAALRTAFRGGPGFEAMMRALALSGDDYVRSAAREISQRLGLDRLVMRWLHLEAARCGVSAFVAALDDVDLAQPSPHAPLLMGLLDELHQARVVFLLAAHLDRFEDSATRCVGDKRTSRELTYKILPEAHRYELVPWTLTDVAAYRAPGAPPNDTLSSRLGTLDAPGWVKDHLLAVSPRAPRGVENLYVCMSPASPTATDRLLANAARGQAEFELGRRLDADPPAEVGSTLRWDVPGMSWRGLVDSAPTPDPLRGLAPIAEGLGLEQHPATVARWAEVLADAALSEAVGFPGRRLLSVFEPAQRAWARTGLRTSFSANALLAPRRDTASFAASFFWTVLHPVDSATPLREVTVGPGALHALLDRDRWLWPDPTLVPDLGDLLALVPEDRRPDYHEDADWRRPEFPTLPRRLRTLLLVVDEIAAGAWAALSASAVPRSLPTLARIAAGLCRAGWLRVLARAGRIWSVEEDRIFLEALDGRGDLHLLGESDAALADRWQGIARHVTARTRIIRVDGAPPRYEADPLRETRPIAHVTPSALADLEAAFVELMASPPFLHLAEPDGVP